MARAGLAAVQRAKQQYEKQQKQWEGQRARDLYLKNDGDEVVLYFVGCEPDEPHEEKVHTVSNVKRFDGKRGFATEICAHGRVGRCVYCYEERKKNKNVKRATSAFFFTVADSRYVHKKKNAEKSKQRGKDAFDWSDCPKTDDAPNAKCIACKKGVPRERAGRKKLRLSLQAAMSLDGFARGLAKRCQNCNGKITLTGYEKGSKTRDDIDDLDEEQQKKWSPVYECSKCDKPNPGNIFSCPVLMRRNGTSTATTYAFEKADEFGDHPKWVQKLEPFNWEEVNTPRSEEDAAEQLGVDNPFDDVGGKKKKKRRDEADDYDDDEEDDDDSDDDDDDDDDDDGEEPFDDDEDEEDEKPRRKSKGKGKKAKRRRDEDDEDDDESDDDEEEDEEDEDD